MDIRIQCLCVDARDPASIASFWEAALGWRRTNEEPDEVVLEPPVGSTEHGVVPDLSFLKVPESKAVKNRLHLDLRPLDQQREVERLESLGTRPRLRRPERRGDLGRAGRSGGERVLRSQAP